MKRLRPDQDAFGRALLDYFDGRHRAATVVERDDGFMESENPAAYFEPQSMVRFVMWARYALADLAAIVPASVNLPTSAFARLAAAAE